MEMNKQKFLKFMIDEIERQQKDMYKTGEGKKVVAVLSQIYTLASDGKFDVHSNRGEEIAEEIKNASKGHIHGGYKVSKFKGGIE